MNVLVGYGYFPFTTARYLEEALAQEHHVISVGTPWRGRPGYAPNVDIQGLVQDLKLHPDLFLYVDSGHAAYLPRNIEKLDCPTAAYLIDVHLGPRLRRPLATLFDYVFVAQKDCVDLYRMGKDQHVEWLPLACDPRIHKDLGLDRSLDLGFVGRVGGSYDRRTDMLQALETRFKLNDYRRPYKREEMASTYSESKIAFNCSISGDVNMRVFEAMACGAMLVTDRIANGLLDLFQDGRHLATFQTRDELLERVGYYLQHDDERKAIAEAGQAEVLAHHTYRCRGEQILETIQASPSARAPLRDATESERLERYADLYSKFRLLDAGFAVLGNARAQRKARLASSYQLLLAILRRIKYG